VDEPVEALDMDSDRLTLTVEQAARLLGISRALAYELVRRGELPSLRLGRRIVVPRRSLESMVDSGGKQPA
jgi:excisionase family DNA binding protein